MNNYTSYETRDLIKYPAPYVCESVLAPIVRSHHWQWREATDTKRNNNFSK